jgi:hypothetical protein
LLATLKAGSVVLTHVGTSAGIDGVQDVRVRGVLAAVARMTFRPFLRILIDAR